MNDQDRLLNTPVSAEPIGFRDFLGLKETVFSFFLLAGMFKGVPGLEGFPVDLTVVSAVASFGFVVHSFFRKKERRFGLLLLLLGFFLAFVPTLLWTHWHEYAVEKASRFYTLTLLGVVAPLYLVRTRKELRRFLCAFSLLSAVATIGALISLLTVGKDVERLLALSASTISLARAVGVVFLFVTVWYSRSTTKYHILIITLIPLILLIAAGERGPIVATGVAFVVTYLLFRRKSWSGLARTVLLMLAFTEIFRFSVPWIPQTSLFRVGTFVGGELGESELERVDYFRFSIPKIPEQPWGVGLGGFADLYGASSSADRVFPHNIFLETFLEGGWLAGLYLALLSWRAVRGSYLLALKQCGFPEFQFLFCLFLFYFANEQVSGELNDSKVFFALISLCIGLGAETYEEAKSRASQFRAPALRSAHIP